MEPEQTTVKTIDVFGNLIYISSVSPLSLPKIFHRNREHEPLSDPEAWTEMAKSIGSAISYYKYVCPWCNFNLEFRRYAGMSVDRIATKIAQTVSSQAHD